MRRTTPEGNSSAISVTHWVNRIEVFRQSRHTHAGEHLILGFLRLGWEASLPQRLQHTIALRLVRELSLLSGDR